MANRFLSNIKINDSYELPPQDGDANQIVVTDGAGNLSFEDISTISGNVEGIESDIVYYEVKNSSGSPISKGKGVMAVGTDGNSGHILIDEMVADGSIEARYFLGVLNETLNNGDIGRVISFGEVDQLNTTGQNGETWTNGQVLWCDPDSAGDFTITEPDGPNVKIPAAFILKASTNGKIQVRVQANEGIHQLHDTKITSTQADGELLVWDNTIGVWKNDGTATIDYTNGRVGIGETSPNSLLHLKQGSPVVNIQSSNSYPYSLIKTTNSVGTTVSAMETYANPAIAYLNTSYTYSGNTSYSRLAANYQSFGVLGAERMRIDSAGNVGIGTTSPQEKLHVQNYTTGESHQAMFKGGAVTVGDYSYISLNNGYSTEYTKEVRLAAVSEQSNSNTTGFAILTSPDSNGASGHERLRITAAGNVGIGTTSPGDKLAVRTDVDNSATNIENYNGGININNSNTTINSYSALKFTGGTLDGNYVKSVYLGNNISRLDLGAFSNGAGDNTVLSVTSTSNVGIGTTSPANRLSLHSTSDATLSNENTYNLSISQGTTTNNRLVLGYSEANNVGLIGAVSTGVAWRHIVMMSQGGNLGIGSNLSPAYKLDVNGTVRFSDMLRMETSGSEKIRLISNDTLGDNYMSFYTNTGARTAYLGQGSTANNDFQLYLQTNNNFDIYTNAQHALRVASNGSVGIGTTSPATILHIDDNASTGSGLKVTGGGGGSALAEFVRDVGATGTSIKMHASANFPQMTMQSTGNTYSVGVDSSGNFKISDNASIGTNDRVTISNIGSVGIGTTSPDSTTMLSIESPVRSGWGMFSKTAGINNWSGFYHDSSSNFNMLLRSGSGVQTAKINSSGDSYLNGGNVGIGTTSPAYQLQLSTNSAAKPTSSAWTVVSDIRVKENIRDYDKGLSSILNIEPKIFDYNGKAGFEKTKDNIGIIAQDMLNIMPETINTYKAKLNEEDEQETELYNFDGHAITFALVNSIKELQQQITDLKTEIETLKKI